MSLARVFVFGVGLFVAAASAMAQGQGEDLRQRQADLFQRLTRAPADLEIMFDYAVVSMRLNDYEPAIATLERMLIFNDDLPRVKLELAVAYYRLGVYDVARLYFDEVLESDPPPTVEARIAPFLDQIERRTAVSAFAGQVTLGGLYSTNAPLGPENSEFLLNFDGDPQLFLADGPKRPDFGLRLSASGIHRYDLGRPNDDAWITNVFYSGQRYLSEDRGDYDAADFRTGPRLALTEEAFGPKLRPFVEGAVVRTDAPVYFAAGAGAEYGDTLGPGLSVFGEARAVFRDYGEENASLDGVYAQTFAGLAWEWRAGSTLRLRAIAETDRADEADASNVELGLRLTAVEAFDMGGVPGFEIFRLPWRARAFVQYTGRAFQAPNPVDVPAISRRDREVRAGVGLSAPIDARWSLGASSSWFQRRSNLNRYELSNFEVGFSATRSF